MISDDEFDTVIGVVGKWQKGEIDDNTAKIRLSGLIENHMQSLPNDAEKFPEEVDLFIDGFGLGGKMNIKLKNFFR